MMGDSAALGGGGALEGDTVAPPSAPNMTAEAAVGGGGAGSNSGSDIDRGRIEDGERNFGGNRWPKQETEALIKIRTDMDTVFREASVKGPLWDEVSRKLAELGYHRNAKKCKEKFENVSKYHKRTKDGRGGKSDGKTYRFFDQLEALDHFHNNPSSSTHQHHHQNQQQNLSQISAPTPTPTPSQIVTTATISLPIPMPMPPVVNTAISTTHVTVPSNHMPQNNIATTQPINNNLTIPSNPSTSFQPSTTNPLPSLANISTDLLSDSMASSYSTSSEDTVDGTRKRKRKFNEYFERLMKQVIRKQEESQKRFLEAIEKREHERVVREEAWRAQEIQRINKEREILAQERSIVAAKDAAIMSFLHKVAEQQNLGQALNTIISIAQPPPPQQIQTPQQQPQRSAAPTPTSAVQAPAPPPSQPPLITNLVPVSVPVPVPPMVAQQQQLAENMQLARVDNNGESSMGVSSSRWPKAEVEALIHLRKSMDNKYQENGPKGPLWEEISNLMKNHGYNRNAKRCKEKWENINKYFKKVKESNKKRPEDSKTCPYFHMLDALYKEKNKVENSGGSGSGGGGSSQVVMPDSMAVPLMVRPEQQWPPQQEDPMEQNQGEEEEDMDENDKDGEEEDGEDMNEGGGSGSSNYEVVPSKPTVGASASVVVK